MKTTPINAIMSHLSDAQYFIDDSTKKGDMARQQINLCKMILDEYRGDMNKEVDWSEFDKLWVKCKELFGKKTSDTNNEEVVMKKFKVFYTSLSGERQEGEVEAPSAKIAIEIAKNKFGNSEMYQSISVQC